MADEFAKLATRLRGNPMPCYSTARFYGPEPALFDKSWQLPDIEALR